MKAIAFCDGSGNSPRGSTAACVVIDPETGEVLAEEAVVLEKCSNNIAEYKGMILALKTAYEIGVRDLEVFSDSQLIVNQTNEEWDVKQDDLLALRAEAWEEGGWFDSVKISWVPREQNTHADRLCREKLDAHSPKRPPLRRPDLNEIASRVD